MAHDASLDVRNIEPLKQNYDYGDGLYMNMDKYKSIEEFRNRKKRLMTRKKALLELLITE